ncbi:MULTISPECIES: hypothetical protein [Noviherbaspirillum]|uniref:hypothetical protein n=1 Tax=Noviherbaspirillum TaxID=1344552 RepID=UPI00124C4328|nr:MULTISPECIES: hypothetical protein [Noviherbaspirillum]
MADDWYSDDTPEQAERREAFRVMDGIMRLSDGAPYDAEFYAIRESVIKGTTSTDEAIAYLTQQAKAAAKAGNS